MLVIFLTLMVVKNLLLIYHSHLFTSYLPNFMTLIGTRNEIEDAITNEQIKKDEKEVQKGWEFRDPKRC